MALFFQVSLAGVESKKIRMEGWNSFRRNKNGVLLK
jgi:hypothetical protein